MHGLTGGSWKRNPMAKVTAVGQPDGKPQAQQAAGPTTITRSPRQLPTLHPA
jgi:hypothetical protein